jgi:spore cortex formation protein SpoVR/YcgB (stage V sporulation)
MTNEEQKFTADKWTAMRIEETIWELEKVAKGLDPYGVQIEIIKSAIGDLRLAMEKLGF